MLADVNNETSLNGLFNNQACQEQNSSEIRNNDTRWIRDVLESIQQIAIWAYTNNPRINTKRNRFVHGKNNRNTSVKENIDIIQTILQ